MLAAGRGNAVCAAGVKSINRARRSLVYAIADGIELVKPVEWRAFVPPRAPGICARRRLQCRLRQCVGTSGLSSRRQRAPHWRCSASMPRLATLVFPRDTWVIISSCRFGDGTGNRWWDDTA